MKTPRLIFYTLYFAAVLVVTVFLWDLWDEGLYAYSLGFLGAAAVWAIILYWLKIWEELDGVA